MGQGEALPTSERHSLEQRSSPAPDFALLAPVDATLRQMLVRRSTSENEERVERRDEMQDASGGSDKANDIDDSNNRGSNDGPSSSRRTAVEASDNRESKYKGGQDTEVKPKQPKEEGTTEQVMIEARTGRVQDQSKRMKGNSLLKDGRATGWVPRRDGDKPGAPCWATRRAEIGRGSRDLLPESSHMEKRGETGRYAEAGIGAVGRAGRIRMPVVPWEDDLSCSQGRWRVSRARRRAARVKEREGI